MRKVNTLTTRLTYADYLLNSMFDNSILSDVD